MAGDRFYWIAGSLLAAMATGLVLLASPATRPAGVLVAAVGLWALLLAFEGAFDP